MSVKVQKNTSLGAVLGLELEINVLECDLEAINHDLDYLYGYKSNLIYNRVFLRKDKVVTSLFEYRRTIKELDMVDAKLQELKNMSIKANQKMDQKLKALDHYQTLWEQEEMVESQKILPFIRK